VAWFAAAHRWLVHPLTRFSDAYASNQFRALQQFFRWLAGEEQLPDPMIRLRAPKVSDKLVPVFTSEELSALEKTCQGLRDSLDQMRRGEGRVLRPVNSGSPADSR
jgi:integrase